MSNLVIVESPAKANTIKKYLGKDFNVLASYGHVRDLLPSKGSVVPEHDFAMKYGIIERNAHHVGTISKALSKAKSLYLATDPDREGEAIAWHVYELMKEKGLLKNKSVHRVVFHEITRTAIQDAVAHPRSISMELVNAQQARRALDYLVGFVLSPLLWKKIYRGLSAGRVQSPALRLISEREEEIKAFKPKEYWSIAALLEKDQQAFSAKLTTYEGKKLTQFSVIKDTQAKKIKVTLEKLAKGQLRVLSVVKKQRKRNPAPPFITSTLQQDAVRKLGFTAKHAMRIAQQLYEGIDVGMGTVGLITYMRTDSVNLAKEAVSDIRDFIQKQYGEEYLPKKACLYKTKARNAQEAHEAIRPTAIGRTPTSLKAHLNKEQFKLYELIWQRSVACQMIHATINTVTVELACGEGNIFRATGSTIAHAGFLSVYQDLKEDDPGSGGTALLPPLKEGDAVPLKDITTNQHFTEPPPRYTEASLIKTLEEHGIGRPSTYAPIIDTLQQRNYVILDKKRFTPTDIGCIVNKFLTQYFTTYVDYGFTADLEAQLDAISRGEKMHLDVLDAFWGPFKQQIDIIDRSVNRQDVTTEPLDEACPECKKPLMIRLGRRGRFIGCSGYPDCSYTRNVDDDAHKEETEVLKDRLCPECKSPLKIKSGRYGRFIGCSSYPDCRHMEPLHKPVDTGVTCPSCKNASLLKRQSRRGKVFYSCSAYPDCNYALWYPPIAEPCPKCQWPIIILKETKRYGKQKCCPQNNCSYQLTLDEEPKK
jgi:DNA topoisomerase-1